MSNTKKFAINRQAAAASLSTSPRVRAPEQFDPVAVAMEVASAELPRLLAPGAVAELLGLTERTLERWRIIGEGPRYVKLSRSTVRYLADDIAAFVGARLKASTAQ